MESGQTDASAFQPTTLPRFVHTRTCRLLAQLLIIALVVQGAPVEALRALFPTGQSIAASGRILYVSNTDPTCQGQTPCFATIQAAINAAQAGDIVRIQSGSYFEQLLVKGKNNTKTATEADRIVIEADPQASAGSVLLQGTRPRCTNGYAVRFQQSRFITLRGLTITGAGGQAIELLGGNNQNHAIHLERNRLFGNGTPECDGGITIARGNPDLLISNNLIYGNSRNGITFSDALGGPHYLLSNTIHSNGWNGVRVAREHSLTLIANNLIIHNGTARGVTGGRVGIMREPSANPEPDGILLLHNLVCGNRGGEVSGPLLDETDLNNLTPNGSEGPGVSASPGCDSLATLFANLNGLDGRANTLDDDFLLADGSPAIDQGIDPRTLGLSVADELFEADYLALAVRPHDGDSSGTAEFDLGALESGTSLPGCAEGETQACYKGPQGTQGVGQCVTGTQTCGTDGTFGDCIGQVLPQAEVCDGLDNDCDGVTDEDLSQTTCGTGACQRTVDSCVNGLPQLCTPGLPGVEICGNGIDEDCNGLDLVCPPVNQPPTITSSPGTAATVGAAYSYDVEATDPDVGDTLTYLLEVKPAGMTIDATTGLIQWTPTAGQVGDHSVTVQVNDGRGGEARQSFSIHVTGGNPNNRAPVAFGNSYEIQADQTLNVPAPGVLGNDSDADQDALTAIKLSDPTKGTLSFNSNGAFSFTPTPATLVCPETPTPTGVSFPEPLLTPLVSEDVRGGAIGLAKGDFNHDGAIDLAVTMSDTTPSFGERSGLVKVMLGNGDGSFQTPATLHTLPGSRFVSTIFGGLRAQDFDGDGELDLVTVTRLTPQVLFFKGRGDGTFAAPAASPGAHQNIDDVHGADLNGDGILDVVTLSFSPSAIAVQLGNGDGTFAAPVAYDVPSNPLDVAIGDVNGDRALDVVVGVFNARRVDVFLNRNDGSGGLLPARSSDPRIGQTTGLYLADFNGDGTLDLGVSGYSFVENFSGGAIGFMAGNGDGTFATPPVANFVRVEASPSRRYTENVAPDLNNDGKPDVMFSSFDFQTNFVFVGLNNGDGTFTVTHWVASPGPVAQPGGSVPVDQVNLQGVVAGDFNGDGVPDVAAAAIGLGSRPGGVSLLLGATPGTFSAPRSSLTEPQFYTEGGPAVGDFTNDGVPEAALVAGNDFTSAITLAPINADGSLGPTINGLGRISGSGEFIAPVIRTADFDRDGNLDLVYLGNGGVQSGPLGRIIVAYGDGTGHFSPLIIPVIAGGRNVVVEDFDGDSFPDLAKHVVGPSLDMSIDIYRNNGPARAFSLLGPAGGGSLGIGDFYGHGLAAADFDQDGAVDLVASIGIGGTGATNNQRSLFLKGHGDGSFDAGVVIGNAPYYGGIDDFDVADLNHDGTLDLIGVSIYDQVYVQLGNGNGTFQPLTPYTAGVGGQGDTLHIADFDRDGNLDLAVAGTPFFGIPGGFVILPGNGDGTFAAARRFAVGAGTLSGTAAVTDVNSDGKADVIVLHTSTSSGLTVLLNNADSGRLCTHVDRFTYTANDGARDSNTATVHLRITPVNHAPVITSSPITIANAGQPYMYGVQAGDIDGSVFAFTLTTAPAGMTINPDTGIIRWTPTSTQAGNRAVTVRVYDDGGLFDEQSFTITVTTQVTVPNVVGQTQAAAEAAITGARLLVGTITTRHSPIVPAGNVIRQNPAAGATVPSGTRINLVVSLGPLVVTGLTAILVTPSNPAILVSQTQAFTATGVFNGGGTQDVTDGVTWASANPAVAAIDAFGVATGAADGTSTISASLSGVTGSTTLAVRAPVTGDTTLPTAAITAPADGAEVTSPTDVIGTASDANFFRYELAYAPAGEDTFTVLATGNTAVTNGVLGALDPTLLINDLYDLKLTVFDLGGNEASATVTVQVARELKVGLFTITFQDLNIPLSGIPITINRTYDSRDKGKGDFGIGWRLDIQTLRIRPNREQGTGWQVNKIGGGLGTFVLVGADQHKVSLTLPGGKVEEFDLFINPSVSPLVPLQTVTASYTPRPGTLGSLISLDDNDLLVIGSQPGDVTLVTFAGDTYNPKRFRYIAADGSMIDIDRTKGVEKVQDLNSNTLTFGPNGITHSSGKSVVFTRDAQGRITQITDPSGNSRTYAYNASGDLITATDFVGNATRFTYNSTHGLLDIIDPTGARVARNEYDADGRLIATVDAQGNRIEFTHNLGTQQEVVRDRLGNVTVFEYDAAGNVVVQTDALGNRTEFTYDSRGNTLTQKDALGRIFSKTYDSQNNVLTSTDFDGNTTTSTYNARRQVLTTTDPEGRVTTNVYDARGNLIQVTDPEGGVTQHTYNAAGNLLTATDPLGNVTTFTYDTFGNKSSETDPLGTVTTFTYNANVRVVSETKAGQTTQFQYDSAQRLTRITDALGHQDVTTYSAVGDGTKPASLTDGNGRVTRFDYDARGSLTRTTFPDSSSTATTYDGEERPLSGTDRDGRTTAFQYDALDRQTKVTNPDGTTVVQTYDAVGRLLSQTDERGNVTAYSYAPNKQTVTDALGNIRVSDFDSQRRLIKTTDALGRITTFAYNSKGNLIRATFPDGSTTVSSYDAVGRKSAETDQAGTTTLFVYDALGRLIRVTDAAGDNTTYTYDALGNHTEQTDANGHITRMAYDLLGRLTSRTLPLGQVETFAYDANGNRTSHTDFNGQITTFTYDTSNRMVSKNLPGGTVVSYAYTGGGLRTQAGGDSYSHNTRGRLSSETKVSGEVLTYTYDAVGNRISVTTPQGTTTYTYDVFNRLSTVVDTAGTTTYTYDAAGKLASTTYPNGVTTTYSYDTLNRLVQMNHTGPGGLLSSYIYTLGPAGNRLQAVEAGPATTGRTVSYTYDAVYRLTREGIDEPGTTNDEAITYSYDGVGNRLQMLRNGVTTTYSYDANDRLLDETTGPLTTTYLYDANGNTLTRTMGASTDTYTYDAENRLIADNVQIGFNPGLVSYTYDADGMRNSKTTGGVTTTFLTDKNHDFAQVVVETTGSTVVTYTYGRDLLSMTRPGVGTRFYQYDGQLSTRQLTSSTGGVTDTYVYDAFGVPLSSTGATLNPYLYTGEQFDFDINLYYNRGRYLNPQTGRFWTRDSYEGIAHRPVSLHKYLYAEQDPVNRIDPSGHFSLAVSVIVGLAILGGLLYFGNYFGQGDKSQPLDPNSPHKFSNHHSVLIGDSDKTVDQVFTEMLKFSFLNKSLIPLSASGRAAKVGDRITFEPPPGQSPFRVKVIRVDHANRIFVVETLQGHPLAGRRYFRVEDKGLSGRGGHDLLIETGAIDNPGRHVDIVKATGPGGAAINLTWSLYMEQAFRFTNGTDTDYYSNMNEPPANNAPFLK